MKNKTLRMTTGAAIAMLMAAANTHGQSANALQSRIAELEAELAEARAQLATAENTLANAADTGPSKIEIGDWKIGGAIRANYALGDYANGAGPSRGGDGGNFALDVFRINVDYANAAGLLAKIEYRWYNGYRYNGYNMLHTGWVGYQLDDASQLQVGVNRVPFGPGAYGVSNSWFFDQHYYVGFADDMDLGIKYSTAMGNLALDLAYYVSDEGQWRGASRDSARYSYDSVLGSTGGYEEAHQFNARAILSLMEDSVPTQLGASLQYGLLNGTDVDGDIDDGTQMAASVHMKNSFNAFTLQTQLTYYHFDIEDDNPWNDDELILMGAFDYAYPVAAEAWIGAITGSYYIETPNIAWLDSVTLFAEYSNIFKSADTHNDSSLFTLGAAWARGGWYIYSEMAYSNGNYFVGGDTFTEFGANPTDEWQVRYNLNFGYYF